MRTFRLRTMSLHLTLVVSLLALSLVSTSRGQVESQPFTATLTGAQEVPSVTTDGTGSATLFFDPTTNALTWSLTFASLTGPATGAHVHGPAAAGSNADIQVDIGAVSGLTSPLAGTATLTDAQASDLLAGLLYLNIHTDLNPGGEIRGQVLSPPPRRAAGAVPGRGRRGWGRVRRGLVDAATDRQGQHADRAREPRAARGGP